MIEESLDKSMNKQWNEYRCKLHKDFKNVGGIEDIGRAKRSKPNSVAEQVDWDFLCDHFGSDALKKRSEVNKQNRSHKQRVTTQGSKSFAAHAEEMRNESTKELPGQIEFFVTCILARGKGGQLQTQRIIIKMRLDDDAASLENAALRTRVKDLEDQLKNWTDVLSRIPRDILLPVQNDTSQASGSNEDL
ncbi:Uncharacterized protein Adt_42335 [Abeliophyllum distichum]|uniref:Uncharacterized protein n=1 Tax=Abeliophyllum distichum TaxID=126358 RepID=A0ABD1PS75_9LAMI